MKSYVLFISMLLFFACQSGDQQSASGEDFTKNTPKGQASVVDEESDPNILQLAVKTKDLSTLVVAVQAAEIEHVLVNAGPLTVFAPVNSAFEALPPGTVDELLKPENKAKLAYILTNHAAPGTFKGRLLKDGSSIYMASGEYVKVRKEENDVFIGDAKIIGTVDASNGVVHLVDKVILPENNG